LAEDAASYLAMDVNPLINRASREFYDQVLTLIEESHGVAVAKSLVQVLEKFQANNSTLFSYICQSDFNLGALEAGSVDLVVSQAAFEHFNDPLQTINQLARVVRPGGVFLAQVDLKTHTPLVRDIDPLSIYRLPDWYYLGFRYPGIPNRVRSDEYVEALSLSGWSDISVIPTQVVDNEYLRRTQPHLASRFRRHDAEMSFLSIVVLARRDYNGDQ
jgi:SAM-dependent methyltransferase